MGSNTLLRVTKGSFIFFSGNVVTTFLQFLNSVILTRYLGLEDYGKLNLALSVSSLSVIIIDFKLGDFVSSSIARGLGTNQLGVVRRFIVSYSIMIAFFGCFVFTGFILASLLSERLNIPLTSWFLIVMGFYSFLMGFKTLLNATFYGYSLYKYQVWAQIFETFSRLILTFFIALILRKDLNILIFIYPVPILITSIVLLPLWVKQVLIPLKEVKTAPNSVWTTSLKKGGVWIVLSLPLKDIQAQLPIWFLNYIIGPESVAIYAVAERGYSFFLFSLRAVESAVFPIVSEKFGVSVDNTLEIIQRVTKYVFWSVIPIFIGCWIIIPSFFELAFSAKYNESAELCRIFLFRLFVYTFILSQRPLLYALNAQKILFYRYVIANILTILLLWISIPKFGVFGSAIAIIGTGIVLVVWHIISIKRLVPEFRLNIIQMFYPDRYDISFLSLGLNSFRRILKNSNVRK